jgi:hypothetical protein
MEKYLVVKTIEVFPVFNGRFYSQQTLGIRLNFSQDSLRTSVPVR